MDVIELARNLGAALQEDERYLKYAEASKATQEDQALNEKVAIIQTLQAAYQGEASKPDADQAALQKIDEQFQSVYGEMMAMPSMQTFNEARNELDGLMNYITQILYLCINGEDPATCEPQQGCGGNCGSCGCDGDCSSCN